MRGYDMNKETDSRYPYTYAADYLRMFGGYNSGGVALSRSDASQIRRALAEALGMDDAELAKKLADHYLADEEGLLATSTLNLLSHFQSLS
jgi:hypothetical protein